MFVERETVDRPSHPSRKATGRDVASHGGTLAVLLLTLLLLAPACALMPDATGGAPPSTLRLALGELHSRRAGRRVLVQAGGEDYLLDAGRAEEAPEVVDFLRSRGVEDLEGIVVSNSDETTLGASWTCLTPSRWGGCTPPGTRKARLPTRRSCGSRATRARRWRWCERGGGWIGVASRRTRESQNTQPLKVRFCAKLCEEPEVELALV